MFEIQRPWTAEFDGTPCAVKAARTVWSGGKGGKRRRRAVQTLPIAIRRQVLPSGDYALRLVAGMKQLMAGGGVALIGITLVLLLSGLFG